MNAKQAVDWLQPERWKATGATERLKLLKAVQKNLHAEMRVLGESDAAMKNGIIGADVCNVTEGMVATVMPMGNMVAGCVELYSSLAKGRMPEPLEITKAGDDLYDIHVFPATRKDKFIYSDRRDYLRVAGEPKQVSPFDKAGGIIAVLGAGNYSSSIEMIGGLFLENCAVVHKPHHLNEQTDKVWARIMQPLVDVHALAFCDSGGRELVADDRIKQIYFTGGVETAKKIISTTDTEFISECGGNNPCLVVPGDKPWTEQQIHHQAMKLASLGKMNGGAVCGRAQTVITSKHWSQREEFLNALREAIENRTPAAGSHYPGTDAVRAGFLSAHTEARVLKPEDGKHPTSDFVLIEGAGEDSYAVHHEAFCQIMSEVPLDVPANADAFLATAPLFCNEKLLGSLASMIMIDDETAKNHTTALENAVTELRYGAVAVNTIPPSIWFNPYLTWGGNEVGMEMVSGYGNFGNLLNFEHVEKSIAYATFVSPGDMIIANKKAYHSLAEHLATYASRPTWGSLFSMAANTMFASTRKDF